MKEIWMAGILILVCLVTGACRNESERLADMADRTVEMQSAQNNLIADTNKELARLNRDIQNERKELNKGFEELTNQRRELHKERRSELAWSESFQFLAIVIAATMPLLLCGYLIWAATRSNSDPELANQVLMQEIVSQRPRFIAGPNLPAIEDRSEKLHSEANSSTKKLNNEGGTDNDVAHCSD